MSKVSLNSRSDEVLSRQAKLEKDIKAFKKKGGKIQHIPFGKSANVDFSFVITNGEKE